MGVLLVLAIAMLSVPVMAQGISGSGGVDILGTNGGIFETEGSAFRFPELADTNLDSLTVGNDKALAIGSFWHRGPMAVATNNLVIKKNQDSGACDSCLKVNVEQVTVGNRNAMAFGSAAAVNNVKLVLNQQ
jgi:hypothetical protein